MKRLVLVRLFGLLAVLALIGGGYEWLTDWRWHESTDDAYLHSDITTISPKVGGRIARLAVTDNQLVRKGDVLLAIDDRDYRARLEEAEALVEARQAALVNLDARLKLQTAAIASAEAQLAGAGAEMTRSRNDLDRYETLVRDQFVSRQRLDVSRADAVKAGAGVRGAAAGLDGARRPLDVLQTERKMDEAQLDQAKAEAEAARIALEDTVITAPADGLVGNRAAEEGAYVRPGQALMAVVPVEDVWVEANFKETQIGRMHGGQPVAVSVDAFPDIVLSGRLDSLAPASGAKFSLLPPDNATGNFTKVVQRIPVKIVIDKNQPLAGRLRPGMSATVSVDTEGQPHQGLAALLGLAFKAEAHEIDNHEIDNREIDNREIDNGASRK